MFSFWLTWLQLFFGCHFRAHCGIKLKHSLWYNNSLAENGIFLLSLSGSTLSPWVSHVGLRAPFAPLPMHLLYYLQIPVPRVLVLIPGFWKAPSPLQAWLIHLSKAQWLCFPLRLPSSLLMVQVHSRSHLSFTQPSSCAPSHAPSHGITHEHTVGFLKDRTKSLYISTNSSIARSQK